jgi:methyl-accepting chemotaxis protein WspA
MFKNMKLQSKLISSFVMMGLIVFVVAILGWNGTMRLNQHLNLITDNVMPSIVTMWELNGKQK